MRLIAGRVAVVTVAVGSLRWKWRWRERIESPSVEVSFSLHHSGLEMVIQRPRITRARVSWNYPAQSSRNGGRQHIGARLHVRASSRHVKHFRRRAKPDREVKLIQIGAAQRILLDLYSRAPPCVSPRFSGFRNSEVRLCSVISETPRMTPLHESSLCTRFRILGADVVHSLLLVL